MSRLSRGRAMPRCTPSRPNREGGREEMARTVRWSLAFVTLFGGSVVGGFLAGPYLRGDIPQAQAQDKGGAPVTTGLPKEFTSYRDVVKKLLPAVVSIEYKAKPKFREDQPGRRPRVEPVPDGPDGGRRFLE